MERAVSRLHPFRLLRLREVAEVLEQDQQLEEELPAEVRVGDFELEQFGRGEVLGERVVSVRLLFASGCGRGLRVPPFGALSSPLCPSEVLAAGERALLFGGLRQDGKNGIYGVLKGFEHV